MLAGLRTVDGYYKFVNIGHVTTGTICNILIVLLSLKPFGAIIVIVVLISRTYLYCFNMLCFRGLRYNSKPTLIICSTFLLVLYIHSPLLSSLRHSSVKILISQLRGIMETIYYFLIRKHQPSSEF